MFVHARESLAKNRKDEAIGQWRRITQTAGNKGVILIYVRVVTPPVCSEHMTGALSS